MRRGGGRAPPTVPRAWPQDRAEARSHMTNVAPAARTCRERPLFAEGLCSAPATWELHEPEDWPARRTFRVCALCAEAASLRRPMWTANPADDGESQRPALPHRKVETNRAVGRVAPPPEDLR